MSGSRRRAVDKARRAVRCLALEVPPDVWRDFHAEIEEAFDALSQPTDALVEALEEIEGAYENEALIGNDFRKFARNTARDALRKLETPDHIDPESLRL